MPFSPSAKRDTTFTGGWGGTNYLCPRIKPPLHYAGLAMSNSATQSSARARVRNSMYLLPQLEERES